MDDQIKIHKDEATGALTEIQRKFNEYKTEVDSLVQLIDIAEKMAGNYQRRYDALVDMINSTHTLEELKDVVNGRQ